jgi:hypothetical protein
VPVIGAITCATLLLACAPPAVSDGLDLIWSARYTRESVETAVPLRNVPGLSAEEIAKTVGGFFVLAAIDEERSFMMPRHALMWIKMPGSGEPTRPLGPILEAALCRVPLKDGRLSFLTDTRSEARKWNDLGAFAVPVEGLRKSNAWTVRTLPVNSRYVEADLQSTKSPLELDAGRAGWAVNRTGDWGVISQQGAVHLVDIAEGTICESLVPCSGHVGTWFSDEGTVLVLLYGDHVSADDVSTVAFVWDYSSTPLRLLGEIRIPGQPGFAYISSDGLSVALTVHGSCEVPLWRVENGVPRLLDSTNGERIRSIPPVRTGRQDRFAVVEEGSVAILEIGRTGFTQISRTHFSNLPGQISILDVASNGRYLLVRDKETGERDLYGANGLIAEVVPAPKPTNPGSINHTVYFCGDFVGPTYVWALRNDSREGTGTIDLYLVR